MANRKKDKPFIRVTISVDPDDYRAIEALAQQEDRSAAYLIRQSMRDFLQQKQEAAAPRRSTGGR